MSKPEELFKEIFSSFEPYEGGSESDIKYYGKHVWNAALEWAAENAKSVKFECDGKEDCEAFIDKQSILKGKL